MPLMDADASQLVLIDYQERLMPAIDGGEAGVAAARRLALAAAVLGVPVLRTEHCPNNLGPTVAPLAGVGVAVEKTAFGACATPAFAAALSGRQLVVAGCETHVCVLQTVLGLRERGRAVFVVADACGSRLPASGRFGLKRMAQAGAEIVTAEMVLFEWLADAAHPRFRDILKLIR